jgi:hypothetical protein
LGARSVLGSKSRWFILSVFGTNIVAPIEKDAYASADVLLESGGTENVRGVVLCLGVEIKTLEALLLCND